MLELIDLSKSLRRAEYKRRLPELQQQLFKVEKAVFERAIPVIILFEGWAAADKGSTIRALTSRMDPRGFRVVPITAPRNHELSFPWLHRFWLKLPNYGEMVIFDQSWYRRLLVERVEKLVPKREWKGAFSGIRDFERALADDGTVIIKFFLHISGKEQAKRIRKLLADPDTACLVTEEERAQRLKYNAYWVAVEDMLSQTEAEWAPWTIVEATDRYFTRVKVFTTILERLAGPVRTRPPVDIDTVNLAWQVSNA